jgi:micrococcal nuclease
MAKRRNKVALFSRDYRRAPKSGMGLPPRRRFRRLRQIPVIGWMMMAVFGLVMLPVLVDAAKGLATPTRGCRIWQITDGDTVKLLCPKEGFSRGRLLGYDSPELFSPRCPSEWIHAVSATYYLRWQIWKARRISTELHERDRYGRFLIDVKVDGQNLARRMVYAGMGRWYDGGSRAGWCT